MKKLIIILLILGLSGCFGSVSRHKAEKTYYLNGQLKVDNNPKDGGWRRTYFDNGQLETEYLYESYKPIPEDLFNWTIYGDTDVLYDGYFKSYHRNGKLAQEGPIKASRRVGLWKQYYNNGAIQEEGYYKGGVKHGAWKEYYESGQLHREGKYKNMFEKEGLWKEYNKTGQLIKEVLFDKTGKIQKEVQLNN